MATWRRQRTKVIGESVNPDQSLRIEEQWRLLNSVNLSQTEVLNFLFLI